MAGFHQVRQGGCWLVSEGVEEYLGPGDLVFIEPGRRHVLNDQPSNNDVCDQHRAILLLCGYCDVDQSLLVPLASLFLSISIIRQEQLQDHAWLRMLLDTLGAEYLSSRPGTGIVLTKLTEVLLVELIRINFGQGSETAMFRALADKKIAQALQLRLVMSQTWLLLVHLKRSLA